MNGPNVTPAIAEAFDHQWCYHILPDGRGVTFSFCESTHVYRLRDPFDGRCFEVPSVTTLLEGARLMPDNSGVPLSTLEKKKTIDTNLRRTLNLALQDKLDSSTLDPQLVPYLSACTKFLTRNRKLNPTFSAQVES